MMKLPTAIAVSLVFAVAACGGSSSGGGTPKPTTTPAAQATDAASKATATAQIKHTWTVIFKSGTPVSAAIPLLENGSKLGAAIRIATKIAKAEKTQESAVVNKVVFVDPTHANVTYNLDGNGKPLLKNSLGKAVLVGGNWRVSQITFCTLVDLGAQTDNIKKVPGC